MTIYSLICEPFNKAILEYRDKPVINLIEGPLLKKKKKLDRGAEVSFTNQIVTQRDLMLRYKGNMSIDATTVGESKERG